MAYCTGRIPALHFYEQRLLACLSLQLCAKSTLDPVWASSATFYKAALAMFYGRTSLQFLHLTVHVTWGRGT